MDFDDRCKFDGFDYGGDFDMATYTNWDDLGFEPAVMIPIQDVISHLPMQDAGDGMSMLHSACSAARHCMNTNTPVQAKAQDYTVLGGIPEHSEFEV